MKTIFALALTTLSFNLFATSFECTNHMYRDARLSVNGDSVRIQDSHVRHTEELAHAVQESLGLRNTPTLQDVALEVKLKDAGCTVGHRFEVACDAQNVRGFLSVKAWVRGPDSSGIVNLNFPVTITRFRLHAHRENDFPEAIRLMTTADAALKVGGKDLDLEWNTFFYASPTNPASNCKFL